MKDKYLVVEWKHSKKQPCVFSTSFFKICKHNHQLYRMYFAIEPDNTVRKNLDSIHIPVSLDYIKKMPKYKKHYFLTDEEVLVKYPHIFFD